MSDFLVKETFYSLSFIPDLTSSKMDNILICVKLKIIALKICLTPLGMYKKF